MTFPIDSLYRLLPRDRQLVAWGPIYRQVEDQQAAVTVIAGGNVNANEAARFHIPTGYHIFVTRIRVLADPGIGLILNALLVDVVDELDNPLMDVINLPGVPLAANAVGLIHENLNDFCLTHAESFLRVRGIFNSGAQVNTVSIGYSGIAIPKGNSARFF